MLRETWLEEFGAGAKGTLVFGAVESKDVSGILKELRALVERMVFCKVGTQRGLPCEELVKFLDGGEEVECFENFAEALKEARNHGGPILIAGSLFLVGEARAELLGGEFLASVQ